MHRQSIPTKFFFVNRLSMEAVIEDFTKKWKVVMSCGDQNLKHLVVHKLYQSRNPTAHFNSVVKRALSRCDDRLDGRRSRF